MVIGAVLTGGKSLRFGSDKARAPVGDETMGSIAVDALRGAGCDPVVAIGGAEGHHLGVPVINDRQPDQGPLGGIASALVWAKTGHLLIIPCDLPLIRHIDLAPLVRWTEGASPDEGAIASIDGRTHPIVAVWPGSAARSVADLVKSGSLRLSGAAKIIRFTPIEMNPATLADADTPQELDRLMGHDQDSQ